MVKKAPIAIDCRRVELDGIRYVILRESAFAFLCEKAGFQDDAPRHRTESPWSGTWISTENLWPNGLCDDAGRPVYPRPNCRAGPASGPRPSIASSVGERRPISLPYVNSSRP